MPGRREECADGSGRASRRILIAIAGRQHADQLAAALAEAGFDVELFLTRRVRPELQAPLAGRIRWRPLHAVPEQIATRLLPFKLTERIGYWTYRRFDRAAARLVKRRRPDVVIGYENCAVETFRAARAAGIPTVLDAASVHHALQAQADPTMTSPPGVDARKDAEVALADHLLTCSTLASDSYVAAGVPRERVHCVPLGFDAALFRPGEREPHSGPLKLAFVGRFTRVKGADVLADALDALAATGAAIECRFAADVGSAEAGIVPRLAPHGPLLGKLPQVELVELYQWADALVLPSRFDSFGLVVPEALACGLPVIVSDRVGAKDLVEPGVNGAILPAGDVGALTETLARFAADPAPLRAMRTAAHESVRGTDWPHYRRRAAAAVASILGWQMPPSPIAPQPPK